MSMKIAFILLTMILTGVATAQTPAPIVVPAASGTPAQAPLVPAQSAPANSVPRALEELKAANDEFLRKQAATLQQLDELQKAVEQLKIYSKRG